MMTPRMPRLALAAVLLGFSCVGPGRAQTPTADATQAIAAVYAQRDAAAERKDIAGATACFAPDFHFIDDKGRSEDAVQYRKRVGGSLHDVKTMQTQTTIQQVVPTPTGAVVTIRQRSQISAEYRMLFVKRTAHVTLDETKRDTWVKASPAWQLKQSQILIHKQDVHP